MSDDEKLLDFDIRDITKTIEDIVEILYTLLRPKVIELVRVIEKSEKKKEIIELINQGTVRQSDIAKELGVDRTTVRDHIKALNNHAFNKIGIPLFRTSRRGLKPTILFSYLIRELKEVGERPLQTLESLIEEEE